MKIIIRQHWLLWDDFHPHQKGRPCFYTLCYGSYTVQSVFPTRTNSSPTWMHWHDLERSDSGTIFSKWARIRVEFEYTHTQLSFKTKKVSVPSPTPHPGLSQYFIEVYQPVFVSRLFVLVSPLSSVTPCCIPQDWMHIDGLVVLCWKKEAEVTDLPVDFFCDLLLTGSPEACMRDGIVHSLILVLQLVIRVIYYIEYLWRQPFH